jgi:hypothetical protein
MEQAMRTCLLSMRLGEALRLSRAELGDVYYVALLRFLGCTADAHETAAVVGGDDIAYRANVAPVLGGSTFEYLGRTVAGLGRGQGTLSRARAVAGALIYDARISRGVAAHCELAENLAHRLGLAPAVRRGLAHALERWDGRGLPGGLTGEDIALSSRVVFLARDVEVLHRLGAPDDVAANVHRRRGAAYDPAVVAAFERCRLALVEELGTGSV